MNKYKYHKYKSKYINLKNGGSRTTVSVFLELGKLFVGGDKLVICTEMDSIKDYETPKRYQFEFRVIRSHRSKYGNYVWFSDVGLDHFGKTFEQLTEYIKNYGFTDKIILGAKETIFDKPMRTLFLEVGRDEEIIRKTVILLFNILEYFLKMDSVHDLIYSDEIEYNGDIDLQLKEQKELYDTVIKEKIKWYNE
ncbi:MAG: hypothetical protein Harvfovirus20_11 [Harvfovirus sp.]|uniref:Uncharacterized protein n=1 Tax=Harvfovirus sp. TaxID=2487768 RepID=A0A3G5A1W8_9VIRU|nr:MAG: hypothetical protein Harvfovirus20_11 [Harvfovirus sp.]